MISKLIAASAFFANIAYANAQSTNYLCDRVSRELDGLSLSDCSYANGVLVEKYEASGPSSSYATDFDRRIFYIAYSKNADALFDRVGVKAVNGKIILNSTRLAILPEMSQIKWRRTSKAKIKKNDWVIFVEDVQYAAQGQVTGFPIECRTAIHQRLPTGGIVAASECFAYEDRGGFLEDFGSYQFF